MPSTAPLPSIQDYLAAYRATITGRRGALLDVREGSGYEIVGGVNAVLLARQARRDQVLFGNAYTDTATGPDLDRHILRKYGVARIAAATGAGQATLVRPSSGTAGTLYAGSRIEVVHPTSALPPAAYRVTSDFAVGASSRVVNVPIEATSVGAGVAVNTLAGIRLADSLFDATFVPVSIVCADGADEELDDDYRARARGTLLTNRVGYDDSIEAAAQAAGATQVVYLDAGALGPALDAGLSFLYVADDSFTTPAGLVPACLLAVESWRVAGCDIQVCGMQRLGLTFAVQVNLWDDPSRFNLVALRTLITTALLDQFNGSTNWWTFRLASLEGLVQGLSSAVQSVTITSTPGEPIVAWQPVLTRYVVTSLSVAFLQGS